MPGGQNKLSLTKTQLNRLNKAKTAGTGIQMTFSETAVNNMIKTGGIFSFAALAPLAIAALKSHGLGAAGDVGSNLIGTFVEMDIKMERDSDNREAGTQNTTGAD